MPLWADASRLLIYSTKRPATFTSSKWTTASSKSQLHYLLRGKRLIDLPPSILENIARIDGAVVMDGNGRVITFGAILRHHSGSDLAVEGGRTTAAITTSRIGNVLKVSEDGLISYYAKGNCVWEM